LNFKPIDLWLIMVDFGRKDNCLLLVLQKVVGEGRSKESSIDVNRSKFRDVNFFAPWAINFKSWNFQLIAEANWQHFLPITECPWTCSV
jgi:hypothetical protein